MLFGVLSGGVAARVRTVDILADNGGGALAVQLYAKDMGRK